MTDKKLLELLVVIDNHYGRIRSKDERRADTQIYIRAFGTIPDEIVEKALYTAFTQCRFQNQLIVDWCAEIKKLLSAQQPSANDLWTQAAAAARKIEANLYYQTHGGFIAPDGRKLKGEDFKKENAKIFAALPMVVQRCAGCGHGRHAVHQLPLGAQQLAGKERGQHPAAGHRPAGGAEYAGAAVPAHGRCPLRRGGEPCHRGLGADLYRPCTGQLRGGVSDGK